MYNSHNDHPRFALCSYISCSSHTIMSALKAVSSLVSRELLTKAARVLPWIPFVLL